MLTLLVFALNIGIAFAAVILVDRHVSTGRNLSGQDTDRDGIAARDEQPWGDVARLPPGMMINSPHSVGE